MPNPNTTQTSDRTSGGLIFREKIIQAPKTPKTAPFLLRCRGQKPTRTLSRRGAASLEHVAMRSILCNLEFVAPETLGCLPAMLVKRVWEAVKRSSLDSVRTWQLFTLALPSDPPGNHTHRVPILEPSITPYLSIDSATFAWLTFLSISDIQFPASDLFELGQVRNLSHLHVASSKRTRGDSIVDDDVLRGWARLARGGSGAFARLQSLVLRGQMGVTERCFEYSSGFPALREVCLSLCGGDGVVAERAARKCGWVCSNGGFHKHVKSHIENAVSAAQGESQSWTTLVDQYILGQHSTPLANGSAAPPLLSVSLGRESQSSRRIHGMDELQWFEKSATATKIAEPKMAAKRTAASVEPGAKRRKVREARKVDLTHMPELW